MFCIMMLNIESKKWFGFLMTQLSNPFLFQWKLNVFLNSIIILIFNPILILRLWFLSEFLILLLIFIWIIWVHWNWFLGKFNVFLIIYEIFLCLLQKGLFSSEWFTLNELCLIVLIFVTKFLTQKKTDQTMVIFSVSDFQFLLRRFHLMILIKLILQLS